MRLIGGSLLLALREERSHSMEDMGYDEHEHEYAREYEYDREYSHSHSMEVMRERYAPHPYEPHRHQQQIREMYEEQEALMWENKHRRNSLDKSIEWVFRYMQSASLLSLTCITRKWASISTLILYLIPILLYIITITYRGQPLTTQIIIYYTTSAFLGGIIHLIIIRISIKCREEGETWSKCFFLSELPTILSILWVIFLCRYTHPPYFIFYLSAALLSISIDPIILAFLFYSPLLFPLLFLYILRLFYWVYICGRECKWVPYHQEEESYPPLRSSFLLPNTSETIVSDHNPPNVREFYNLEDLDLWMFENFSYDSFVAHHSPPHSLRSSFYEVRALSRDSYLAPCLTDDRGICVICMNKLEVDPGETIIRLDCYHKHLFHQICIRPWLNRNPICPICRTPIHINRNI